MKSKTSSARFAIGLLLLPCLVLTPPARAAELTAADNFGGTGLGSSAGLSGDTSILSSSSPFEAPRDAFLFRQIGGAGDSIQASAKLSPSETMQRMIYLNGSVSLSGNPALIGATDYGTSFPGTARPVLYLFRNLDTATGNVTESAKLVPLGGAASETFGRSLSLSGTTAVVGGGTDAGSGKGAAYVFRNLDTASGNITETARLTASDTSVLAGGVGFSGNTAVVGAGAGSAYVFRNINTASGTVTEQAKLASSDSAANGYQVSVSGQSAVTTGLQAGYLYRNLDTASGTITEAAKLTPFALGASENFGTSVSLSGGNALIGSRSSASGGKGVAYLFRNLDTAAGTVRESVKITSAFGMDAYATVALDGDVFAIGSRGRAYSGRVSAITTLDEGNSTRSTIGLSFTSQEDWIIGESTDANRNTFTEGLGSVSAAGKGVYVGRNAGADQNSLTVAGGLTANFVRSERPETPATPCSSRGRSPLQGPSP